jgi:hypothetical protein
MLKINVSKYRLEVSQFSRKFRKCFQKFFTTLRKAKFKFRFFSNQVKERPQSKLTRHQWQTIVLFEYLQACHFPQQTVWGSYFCSRIFVQWPINNGSIAIILA